MGSARTTLLVLSILVLATMPITVSADSDGDGVSDSTDDCIWSSGTSSVDRVGCPDRDGDGISDYNDGWAANNPNFQNEFTLSSSQNYIDVDFSDDDQFVVTGDEDGWVRIWNSTTHVNVRSAQAINGGEVTSVAYSPDNTMIAAGSLVSPNKKMKSGFLYKGSPAKPIRELTDKELDYIKFSSKHYVSTMKQHIETK